MKSESTFTLNRLTQLAVSTHTRHVTHIL